MYKDIRNAIQAVFWGDRGLFTDPFSRLGGEKNSYTIPTCGALTGMFESIYWKPTFYWVIDAVRIMNRIKTGPVDRKLLKITTDVRDMAIYNYLRNVRYQVTGHFEWNLDRPDLKDDRNEDKHYSMANRYLTRGGRLPICFGTSECWANVEPCVFGSGDGYYDNAGSMDFGLMFHSYEYREENGHNTQLACLFKPEFNNGYINFCRREDIPEEYKKVINVQKSIHHVINKNVNSVENEERFFNECSK